MMALYTPKSPVIVDILILPDGSGLFVQDGKTVPITKADIETQYVPFVTRG